MSKPTAEGEKVAVIGPAALPDVMPSRPLLSSSAEEWGDLVLQHYQHPPATIVVPAVRDHLLTMNLGGPFLVAKRRDGGGLERRWADNGHLSLTPAEYPFWREALTRADLLFLHVSPELVAQVAEDAFGTEGRSISLVPRFVVPDDALHRLGQLLLAEARAGAPGTGLMADMLSRAIVLNLLRRHSNLTRPAPEGPPSLSAGRLRRVIQHMREHIHESLPLSQLASLSGLSQSQFGRGFREATGQPPHRYLVALRIEKACGLLAHTDQSIIDVALQCGFERPAYFATTFQKVTGMSPRAWRIARRM